MAISRHLFARSALIAIAGDAVDRMRIWTDIPTAAVAAKMLLIKDLPRLDLGRVLRQHACDLRIAPINSAH
jgi:hypothetical protein